MIRVSLVLLITAMVFAAPSPVNGQDGVVSLVSSVEFPGKRVTDVTSYVDVLTGIEYAIVGHSGSGSTGIAVVDLSDPALPQVVSTLDGPPGFDVKVFDRYAYTVTGGGGTGAIIDISNPFAPVRVAGFTSTHNIFIDHKGYMYSSSPGLEIYDLNTNPLAPDSVWYDGRGGGHDASVIGDTLYDFHGSSGTFIYDVTDRSNPVEIGHITAPFVTYHHSGWVTDDRRYLFINDELSTHPAADVTIWDISDTSDPEFVTSISDSLATVHNLHIVGDHAFFSYYAAGFKVFDVSDPGNPVLVGSYDTDPMAKPGFSGAFGVDAFLPSGHVLVSGTSGIDP
ncbi:MAG: choice-of-anchor B family protein, partial [Rhodothermales bacterium]|nr:choice-of-anchor B family protein [Rhodothermales bacterium]